MVVELLCHRVVVGALPEQEDKQDWVFVRREARDVEGDVDDLKEVVRRLSEERHCIEGVLVVVEGVVPPLQVREEKYFGAKDEAVDHHQLELHVECCRHDEVERKAQSERDAKEELDNCKAELAFGRSTQQNKQYQRSDPDEGADKCRLDVIPEEPLEDEQQDEIQNNSNETSCTLWTRSNTISLHASKATRNDYLSSKTRNKENSIRRSETGQRGRTGQSSLRTTTWRS